MLPNIGYAIFVLGIALAVLFALIIIASGGHDASNPD